MKALKVAFLDRDGALIWEPVEDRQIDSLEKLKILDGVIEALKLLIEKGYILVIVSNQNGLGTQSFPYENFEAPQRKMLEIFAQEGIKFTEIFVCPHFPDDGCLCRKPEAGLVKYFLAQNEIDYKNSFMYGDRDTDGEFAKNIGVKFIKTEPNTNAQSIINFLTENV